MLCNTYLQRSVTSSPKAGARGGAEFTARPSLWLWPQGNCSFPAKYDFVQDLFLNVCSSVHTLKFQFHSLRKHPKKPLRRAGRVAPGCTDDHKEISSWGHERARRCQSQRPCSLFAVSHDLPLSYVPLIRLHGVLLSVFVGLWGMTTHLSFPGQPSFPLLVLVILQFNSACGVVSLMQLVFDGSRIFT